MALDEEAERQRLYKWLPFLWSRNLQITSPTDPGYNCVAWAAGDNTKFWSPAPVTASGKPLGGYYWPDYAPMLPAVTAAEAVFQGRGYVRTNLGDTAVESAVEKIAIFGYDSVGFVTHVARQCASGLWTSKMGEAADIEHALRDIEGSVFGEVRSVMRKGPNAEPTPNDPSTGLILVQPRSRER